LIRCTGLAGVLNKCSAGVQDIDRLCTECSNLIDNHDKIQELSAVHYNLGKTLQDVQNIVALPHEAAEAEEMLRDDSQLLQVLLADFRVKVVCHCGLMIRVIKAWVRQSVSKPGIGASHSWIE